MLKGVSDVVEIPVTEPSELNKVLVLGLAELGSQAPLSHVPIPSRGNIQICSANQAPMNASGIQISLINSVP